MTGHEIKRMRRYLGLDPFALAAVLGVHVSTIYRWESSTRILRMDPLQSALTNAISSYLDSFPKFAGRLQNAIVSGLVGERPTYIGLMSGGTLPALHKLLGVLLGAK